MQQLEAAGSLRSLVRTITQVYEYITNQPTRHLSQVSLLKGPMFIHHSVRYCPTELAAYRSSPDVPREYDAHESHGLALTRRDSENCS